MMVNSFCMPVLGYLHVTGGLLGIALSCALAGTLSMAVSSRVPGFRQLSSINAVGVTALCYSIVAIVESWFIVSATTDIAFIGVTAIGSVTFNSLIHWKKKLRDPEKSRA